MYATELTSVSFLQTTEAEATSLNQRRKIDVLEAQLNEAEDVITDLRTELTQLWDKLDKVKRNQVKSLKGRITKEGASSHENSAAGLMIPSTSSSGLETATPSDMKNVPLDQRVSVNKFCNTDNHCAHNSDFASVTVRTKEPELYRNGFTQRIRACERNFQDGKVPPEDIDDQQPPKKNELMITQMIHKEEGKCPVPSTRISNMKMMKNSTGDEVKKPIKVRTSRRRRPRFGKAKANSRKSRPGHLLKPCQQPSILSCGRAYSVNGVVKSTEGACTIPSIKAGKEEVNIVHKGEGENAMKNRDVIASFESLPHQLSKPCQSSSVLSCCRTFPHSVNGNVKSGEDRLTINETKSKIKPLTRLDPGLTLIKRDVDPRSGSTNLSLSIKATNKSGLIQNVEEDTELDDSVSVNHEGDAVVNSMHPSPELNIGMVVPPINSDLKDAEASEDMKGSTSQADNRLLRYTFQRKRKKESSGNPDESASLEKSTVKRRAGEKQSGAPGPQNSSLNYELSRDSRRLAQVARQVGFLPLPITPLIVSQPKIPHSVLIY